MSIEDMRKRIEWYCADCGSCDNCGLMNIDSPVESNCYTWATDEEVKANYDYLVSHRYI